jgi:hypothetical protein
MSCACGKIPEHGIWAHAMGPTLCGSVVWRAWTVGKPRLDLTRRPHKKKETPGILWTTLIWDALAMLHDDQVSRGDPGCTADLEGARGCWGEEGSQRNVGLQEGLRWEVGLKTQRGLLALRLRR